MLVVVLSLTSVHWTPLSTYIFREACEPVTR